MYVTLDQFKDYAGITTPPGDPGDLFLQELIDRAEAVIADYLKNPDPDVWVGNLIVQAATLRQAMDLYRWRGDDADTLSGKALAAPPGWSGTLGIPSPLVANMLHRLRDPALA